MRRTITAGILVAAAVLQGCAIAPGMTMDEPAELPEGKVVRVQTLTMELLNQLEARLFGTLRRITEFLNDFMDSVDCQRLNIAAYRRAGNRRRCQRFTFDDLD